MNNTIYTIILIATAALVTLLIRALPFMIFGGNRQMPPKVRHITNSLPPAIIAVLVVYCLKDYIVNPGVNTISAAISIILVIGVHLWKKNTLLSISIGTIIYMILIRVINV